MEEDLSSKRSINSPYLEKSLVKRQIDILKQVADEAEKKLQYEQAHNPEILKAIHIIEHFLRKSGRVCYGGQAINANLPTSLKFYDEDHELPDYDFFTPNLDQDLQTIVKELTKEGFTEISEKVGIHEGTKKIFVNFIAVADITYLEPDLYKRFYKQTIVIAGIRYCNPDILRMNMYLELSRPRGQVERWEKVYQRLLLLNHAHPIRACENKWIGKRKINPVYREKIVEYMIKEKRTLAGAEIGFVYRRFADEHASMDWVVHSGGTILMFSPDLKKDTEEILDILEHKAKVELRPGFPNVFPDRILIRKGGQLLVYMIQEDACNSYNEIKLKNTGIVHIASLDTLITLYLQLGFLTADEKVLGIPVACLAQRFIELQNRIRMSSKSKFPAFSLTCSGHQTSFASLQRERKMKAEKAASKKTRRNKKIEKGAKSKYAKHTRRHGKH
jgi:Poly(A) polymerase catalytic subunit